MLEIGTKAPDFELPDQNGEMHKLSILPSLTVTKSWEYYTFNSLLSASKK